MILTSMIIAGVAVAIGVGVYWDRIKAWLNNTFADAIERTLGYSARNTAQKAIAAVDQVMDKVRNVSRIYSKESLSATKYDRVTIISEASITNVEEDMRDFLKENNGHATRTFDYDKQLQEFVYAD